MVKTRYFSFFRKPVLANIFVFSIVLAKHVKHIYWINYSPLPRLHWLVCLFELLPYLIYKYKYLYQMLMYGITISLLAFTKFKTKDDWVAKSRSITLLRILCCAIFYVLAWIPCKNKTVLICCEKTCANEHHTCFIILSLCMGICKVSKLVVIPIKMVLFV